MVTPLLLSIQRLFDDFLWRPDGYGGILPFYRVLVDVDQIKSKLVAALENALRSLLKDPTFAQELGGKARETVEEGYSITQTASRMLEAYESLAGQPGSRR